MVIGITPPLATTSAPVKPEAFSSRSIQPSKPSPLTKKMSAPASILASAGVGLNTCASPLGPTSIVTSTRSPPTFFTMSPRMLNEATALTLPLAALSLETLSAACTAPERPSMTKARAMSVRRRFRMTQLRVGKGSGFQMLAGHQPPEDTAPHAPKHGQEVENAAGEDDGGAGRYVDVIRDEQPGDARAEGGSDGDGDHAADILGPEPRGHRRQQHDADRHQRAERLEAGDEIEHHEHQKQEMGRRA